MKKRTIVIMVDFTEEEKQELESYDPNAEYMYVKREEVTKDICQSAHVILGYAEPNLIRDSETLEWMQITSAGINAFTGEGNFPKQAILTNASGAYGAPIAEHMLAMLLMLSKNMHVNRDNQTKEEWAKTKPGQEIMGSTTLVLVLGDIGSEFAKRAKMMGSYVIGVRRTDNSKPDFVDEIHLIEDVEKLLPRADFIAMAMPGTKESTHVLDKKRLSMLRENAIIINVGRGTAIDTEALCDVLESGKIHSAGLDVTDPEPLPKGHRAWGVENLFITPHSAGSNSPSAIGPAIRRMMLDNYKAFVNGAPLNQTVDLQNGY